MLAVSVSRGMTLRKIITPMNKEQIGSAIFQSKYCMRRVEMITPTLPRVSASTCKNTPVNKHLQCTVNRYRYASSNPQVIPVYYMSDNILKRSHN